MIADDHHMLRLSFYHVAKISSAFTIVAEASTAEEAIELCGEVLPQVVVMDLMIPEMGGLEATRIIRSRWPAVRVIMLSGYCEGELVRDALRAGSSGYLAKFTFSKDDMVDAIRKVAAGETVMSEVATVSLAEITRFSYEREQVDRTLTAREHEILGLLVRGYSNMEIAQALSLSPRTAKAHVNSIIRKLKAKNRTEAAARAIQLNLLGSVTF